MGVSRVKWGSCFRPESSYWMAGSSKLHQNSVFVQNLVTCFVFQTAFQSDLLVQSYCPGAIQPQCFSSFIPLHLEPCSSRTEDSIPLNLWSNWGQPYMKDFLSPSDFLGSKMIPKMMIFFSKTTSLSQKWWFFLHKNSPAMLPFGPGGAGYLSKFLIQVILNQICTSGSTTRHPRSEHRNLGFFEESVQGWCSNVEILI